MRRVKIFIGTILILICVTFSGFSMDKSENIQDTLEIVEIVPPIVPPKLKKLVFSPKEIVPKKGYIPKEGFVPNAETAIKIAEAIWLNIYGEKVLEKKPYKVKLRDGIWYVEGSLPIMFQGGVPYIQILKKNGMILKVYHTK